MIEDKHRTMALSVLLPKSAAMQFRHAAAKTGIYDHLAHAGLVIHSPAGWVITKEGEQWLRNVVG